MFNKLQQDFLQHLLQNWMAALENEKLGLKILFLKTTQMYKSYMHTPHKSIQF